MFFVIILLLPAISHQYTIKVQGKVEMGDEVASILKSLYSQISPDGKNFASLIQNVGFGSDTVHSNDRKGLVQAKPFLEEVMEKNQIGHIYGSHDEKAIRNQKDFNNIHV